MTSPADPLLLFFGVPCTAPPKAILNLPPGPIDEEAVLAALRARLAALAARPESATVAADAARDVLHRAAQDLLSSATSEPLPSVSVAPVGESDLMEVRAMLASPGGLDSLAFARLTVLANARGTTPQRLVAMATGQAVPPSPSSPASQPAPARPVARPVPQPTPARVAAPESFNRVEAFESNNPSLAEIDPTSHLLKLVLIVGATVVAFLGIGTIVLFWALRPEPVSPPPLVREERPSTDSRGPVIAENTGPAAPTDPATQDRSSAPDGPTDTRPAGDRVAANRVREWADVARTLDACVANARIDPAEATASFESAVDEMSRRWVEASSDGVLASSNSVIDFLYAVSSDPSLADRAAKAVLRGLDGMHAEAGSFPTQDGVLAFVWSCGMATRAGRERDLPGAVQRDIQERLGAVLSGGLVPREPTFREGLASGLLAAPASLIPTRSPFPNASAMNDAWTAWLRAVETAYGKESPSYERTVGLALEAVLLQGIEPTQERDVYELVAKLVTSLSWRKDSPARTLLMRWFQTDGVTSGDLQAVTSALATRSSAEGVDPTMVLSATSGPGGRSELRDRYAAAWELLPAGHGRYSEMVRWSDAARKRISEPVEATLPARMLSAVLDARLCKAAADLLSGALPKFPDDIAAVDPLLMERVRVDADPNAAKLTVIDVTGGNPWALQYLIEERSGNLPEKIRLLTQFAGNIDALTASVIAEAAVRGSPDEVRKAAQSIVRNNASDPLMVNALLRVQPKIIPSVPNTQLIEHVVLQPLPGPRDPTWRFEVRRALVGRLLQLMAGESGLSVLDALAKLLADAYTRDTPESVEPDAPPTQDPSATPPAAPSRDPLFAARGLRSLLEREADRLVPTGREPQSLPQISLARRQREILAQGAVQQFNVEQLACLELLAFITVAEDPTRSESVTKILATLAEERHRATHIIEQVAAAERASLELWIFRVGVSSEQPVTVESTP